MASHKKNSRGRKKSSGPRSNRPQKTIIGGTPKPGGKHFGSTARTADDGTVFGDYLFDATHPYVRVRGRGRGTRTRIEPTHRLLRIYTLDPEVSKLDGAITTARVPYESLAPGPVGHLFIVDLYDEVQGVHYSPADLDDRFNLGQAGRDPSPSDPQFHAQMVYAVASVTYECFRRALGRHLNWGSPRANTQGNRIVLRPFGSGDRNAYYDKKSGEIRFGYFYGDERVEGPNLPRGYIFTSLSHDVIAHETTHAILDGLRPHFIVPSNPDVYGFHEGFADVVALMQHFSYPDVVAAAIRHSASALESSELLTDIARQFGHTTGSKGALRSVRRTSDVGTDAKYRDDAESHEIGSVFASAVFEAFATIYHRRAAATLRIAGVGPTPRVERLSAELQKELAGQAAAAAEQFLAIAIRAVDLCPPVDLELGEFLRAAITADYELFPNDPWCYREAWIDAFRKREIYPSNVSSLSEDALLWRAPEGNGMQIETRRFAALDFQAAHGKPARREEIEPRATDLWQFIHDSGRLADFGLTTPDPKLGVQPAKVVSIRSSRRIGQDGEVAFDVIAQNRAKAHD